MNRGSPPPSGRPRSECPRFNEAPIHESGKLGPSISASGTPRSFNEAPIHESGKLSCIAFRRTSRPGFNEAPIHESGK